MNYLNIIFGCIGKDCPNPRCPIGKLICNKDMAERLKWWNELDDYGKQDYKDYKARCDMEDKTGN